MGACVSRSDGDGVSGGAASAHSSSSWSCASACAAPDTPANPEAIDLSHFEQLKVVGKGGFGKVNATTRKLDGALMALKRMAKCEVIKKESHIRMVWTERNIMAKLSSDSASASPFLVTLEHAFQSPRELFFVMEFMQGGDLRFHLTKRGLMRESECRFYAAEMLLGLESMHRQKIIYRDLKPDNVLVDSAGHIRISDFGLAVQLEEKFHYVMKGNAGTAGYLAPEVWCLPHGTQLALPHGGSVAIERVAVGQQLVGQDGRLVRVRARRDRQESDGLFTLTHADGSSYSATAEHRLTVRVDFAPQLFLGRDASKAHGWACGVEALGGALFTGAGSKLQKLKLLDWDCCPTDAHCIAAPEGVRMDAAAALSADVATEDQCECDGVEEQCCSPPLLASTSAQLLAHVSRAFARMDKRSLYWAGQLVDLPARELFERRTEFGLQQEQEQESQKQQLPHTQRPPLLSSRLTPLPSPHAREDVWAVATSLDGVSCSYLRQSLGDGATLDQSVLLLQTPAVLPQVLYHMVHPLSPSTQQRYAARDGVGFRHLERLQRLLHIDTSARAGLLMTELAPCAHAAQAAESGSVPLAELVQKYDMSVATSLFNLLLLGSPVVVSFGSHSRRCWLSACANGVLRSLVSSVQHIRAHGVSGLQLQLCPLARSALPGVAACVTVWFAPSPSAWHRMSLLSRALSLAHGVDVAGADALVRAHPPESLPLVSITQHRASCLVTDVSIAAAADCDSARRYALASGVLTHNCGDYYGISPDVWSLGVTCYELLHGRRPYRRWNPAKNYIERIKYHPSLSPAARAFIKGLLTVDPRKRLACGPSGWSEVKSHPFFAKIDWVALGNKACRPPIAPDLKQANCSNQADLADQLVDKKPTPISDAYQKYFTGFEFNVNFGEWLLKNEVRKIEDARRLENMRKWKEEHRKFRREMAAQAAAMGQSITGMNISSTTDYGGSRGGWPGGGNSMLPPLGGFSTPGGGAGSGYLPSSPQLGLGMGMIGGPNILPEQVATAATPLGGGSGGSHGGAAGSSNGMGRSPQHSNGASFAAAGSSGMRHPSPPGQLTLPAGALGLAMGSAALAGAGYANGYSPSPVGSVSAMNGYTPGLRNGSGGGSGSTSLPPLDGGGLGHHPVNHSHLGSAQMHHAQALGLHPQHYRIMGLGPSGALSPSSSNGGPAAFLSAVPESNGTAAGTAMEASHSGYQLGGGDGAGPMAARLAELRMTSKLRPGAGTPDSPQSAARSVASGSAAGGGGMMAGVSGMGLSHGGGAGGGDNSGGGGRGGLGADGAPSHSHANLLAEYMAADRDGAAASARAKLLGAGLGGPAYTTGGAVESRDVNTAIPSQLASGGGPSSAAVPAAAATAAASGAQNAVANRTGALPASLWPRAVMDERSSVAGLRGALAGNEQLQIQRALYAQAEAAAIAQLQKHAALTGKQPSGGVLISSASSTHVNPAVGGTYSAVQLQQMQQLFADAQRGATAAAAASTHSPPPSSPQQYYTTATAAAAAAAAGGADESTEAAAYHTQQLQQAHPGMSDNALLALLEDQHQQRAAAAHYSQQRHFSEAPLQVRVVDANGVHIGGLDGAYSQQRQQHSHAHSVNSRGASAPFPAASSAGSGVSSSSLGVAAAMMSGAPSPEVKKRFVEQLANDRANLRRIMRSEGTYVEPSSPSPPADNSRSGNATPASSEPASPDANSIAVGEAATARFRGYSAAAVVAGNEHAGHGGGAGVDSPRGTPPHVSSEAYALQMQQKQLQRLQQQQQLEYFGASTGVAAPRSSVVQGPNSEQPTSSPSRPPSLAAPLHAPLRLPPLALPNLHTSTAALMAQQQPPRAHPSPHSAGIPYASFSSNGNGAGGSALVESATSPLSAATATALTLAQGRHSPHSANVPLHAPMPTPPASSPESSVLAHSRPPSQSPSPAPSPPTPTSTLSPPVLRTQKHARTGSVGSAKLAALLAMPAPLAGAAVAALSPDSAASPLTPTAGPPLLTRPASLNTRRI